MDTKIRELKEELKETASQIRKLRIEYKNHQKKGEYSLYIPIGSKLKGLQWGFRHKHIAYCLLRGRTMEQIEKKNREGNAPNHQLIKSIMEAYQNEEAIHISA